MRLLHDIAPALLAILLSIAPTTAAVPTEDAKGSCIVPLVIFNSLPKTFTLAALAPKLLDPKSERAFAVRIVPFSPTKKVSSKPIISNARIALTQFKLKDQKLIVEGFKAKELPAIEIFPPVLRSFVWGGGVDTSPLNFTAAYSCDNAGKQFLALSVDGFDESEQTPCEHFGKCSSLIVKLSWVYSILRG